MTPRPNGTVFYMDLRTSGKGFEEYKVRGAKVSGIKYVRGHVAEILQDEELNPVVYYEDTEQRKVMSMTLDMVILANACSASRGIAKLAELLGLELEENNFVKTHPNRRWIQTFPEFTRADALRGRLIFPSP